MVRARHEPFPARREGEAAILFYCVMLLYLLLGEKVICLLRVIVRFAPGAGPPRPFFSLASSASVSHSHASKRGLHKTEAISHTLLGTSVTPCVVAFARIAVFPVRARICSPNRKVPLMQKVQLQPVSVYNGDFLLDT